MTPQERAGAAYERCEHADHWLCRACAAAAITEAVAAERAVWKDGPPTANGWYVIIDRYANRYVGTWRRSRFMSVSGGLWLGDAILRHYGPIPEPPQESGVPAEEDKP
jgi:hypothetical protein